MQNHCGVPESVTVANKDASELVPSYAQLFKNGVWHNNASLVQLLGLCPLLAVSNNVVNALGLGLATMAVLICSNTIISLVRHWIPTTIRLPVFIIVIASLVSCVELLMNAYVHQLYLTLGIFIPLIVTNCIVVGRAEAFASKNSILLSAFDGFSMGLGMTCVLVVLGGIRELLSRGTLFADFDQLVGHWGAGIQLQLIHFESPFVIAMLPPGAFLAMGGLIAIKNKMVSHQTAPIIEDSKSH